MIKIQKLTKKYDGTTIFENASLTLPDKGLVCILGPSGCGKSTLLNLLAGFDSVYEGDISVHGKSLSKMNAKGLCAYRRDNIGFVFQNYHLISGYTALENIMLASDVMGEKREKSEPRAKELLRMLGILEKAEQKAETLSGGQKQRVAIARALINQPSIIICDEPTGALDRENSTEIMELLKSLSENRLVLVVTHDKKCAEYAEQIVTIQNGKLNCKTPAAKSDETAKLRIKTVLELSLVKRAWKNLQIHFKRYTAVALAISIGVLCFALSLSSGNIMEQSIAEFEEKNTAYHNGYVKADGNEKELLEQLGKDKRLENIYAQYVLKDIAVKIDSQTEVMAEKYPTAKTAEKMSYGVMPRRGENEAALSPSIASKFDKNIQNLIGKKAELSYNGKTYSVTVSGIFNGTYDDYFVSSDIEQKMYEGCSEKAYSVSYDVIKFEEIVSVSDSLKEQGIASQNASAEVAAFLETFENLDRLFFTVSALIFAVGIFISAILLVKQQNTRFHEVGLLSALGYTKDNIQILLFCENCGLAVMAALCSGILAVLGLIVGKIAHVAIVFTGAQILAVICMTAILVLGIGLISSVRLISTEPAKALRK